MGIEVWRPGPWSLRGERNVKNTCSSTIKMISTHKSPRHPTPEPTLQLVCLAEQLVRKASSTSHSKRRPPEPIARAVTLCRKNRVVPVGKPRRLASQHCSKRCKEASATCELQSRWLKETNLGLATAALRSGASQLCTAPWQKPEKPAVPAKPLLHEQITGQKDTKNEQKKQRSLRGTSG